MEQVVAGNPMNSRDENQAATAVLPNPASAMTFAGWSETEARERIARLLASGWRTETVALMFGIKLSEIYRLVGHSEARTMPEVS